MILFAIEKINYFENLIDSQRSYSAFVFCDKTYEVVVLQTIEQI